MRELQLLARKSVATLAAMVLLLAYSQALPLAAMAQDATSATTGAATSTTTSTTTPSTTAPAAAAPAAPVLPGGFLLDLSSQTASIPAAGAAVLQTGGTLGADGTVTGGTAQQLQPGQLLTPAQQVALNQVVATGHQQLVLNSAGQAVGGFASLTPGGITSLSQLVVPTGVSLNGIGFTQNSPLTVTGNANIQGSLFALQTTAGLSSVFNFGGLTVGPGGMITTALPAYANLLQNVVASSALTMNVAQNVVNNGTIATAGTLNINAGGSITNQSLNGMQAVISAQLLNLSANTVVNSGQLAALEALNNLNIVTNSLTNSGVMQALRGDIGISSLTNSLNINNTSGSIKAANELLMQTLATSQVANSVGAFAQINLNGGDLEGSSLRFNSPQGLIDVDANRLIGPVIASGGIASIGARTGDVNISALNLTGDPIFFAQNGSLDLTGIIGNGGTFGTGGADFVALASGNITGVGITNPTTVNAGGGVIALASGVNFTVNGGSYSIAGPSTTGGSITLPTVSFVTTSNNISLLANAGLSSAGNIVFDAATTSTANAGNASGNLSVVAAGSFTANGPLQTAGINGANGGNMTLGSGTNVFNLSSLYTRSTDNGNFNPCAGCANTGQGTPGSLVFQQNGVNLASARINFQTGSEVMVDGNSSTSTSPLSFTLTNSNQLGTIDTANSGSGTAGSITITGTGNVNLGFGGAWVISSALNGGTAGSITIASPGSITVDGVLDAAGVNNGKGGNIILDSSTGSFQLTSVITRSTDNTNASPCAGCAQTGTGSSGTLTFRASGIVLGNPNVNFATGSEILLDGNNVGTGPSVGFNLVNGNQLGTINVRNRAQGQNTGNITISGNGAVNLGFNGAWLSASSLNGGRAGNISITSPGAISANVLDVAGVNNGSGGSISLSSGTGSFTLGSLYTRSTDNTNWDPCAGCARTGTGTSGTLTFRQGAVVLASPTINFATGSEILVDGGNSFSSPSVSFTAGNANQLGTINTQNSAAGQNGGSITLNSLGNLNLGFNGAWVSSSSLNGGTAGTISLTSPGSIATATIDAAGINNGRGGSITLNSGTAAFSTGSLYTRSTDNTNWDPCAGCAQTGTGSSGLLVFKQGAATLAAPVVNFSTGSQVMVDGANLGTGPSISFVSGNSNQLGAMSTVNAAAGQTAGNITIGGITDVNLGFNGDWVSASQLNGGKAGNVSISSPGAISTGTVNAASINNGTGGNITLDSAISSFASGSLYTRSTDNTNTDPCGGCSKTGTGKSGTISFKQSGVGLVMPTVAFQTGSEVMVDGTNIGIGPSISFRSGNANQLGAISTVNAAAGQTAGDITISGVNDVAFGLNGAWVSASEINGGTAGNISISSPMAIIGGTVNAAAINNGTGGDISFDSGTGSFTLGSLYTRSTNNTNPDPCGGCSGSGSGTSGNITFSQAGLLLANPVVAFSTGSEIMVDGTNPGSTPSISFVSANSNRLGAISTVNAAAGQTSGNITIGGLDDVNLGNNGAWVSSSEINGGTSGSISISSPKAISTFKLNAAAVNNGTGGNITLDSGTNSFQTGSIYTRSTNNNNNDPCSGCTGTGTGSAGILRFLQSGVQVTANYTANGTPEILLDGTNAGSTSTFSLNVPTAVGFGDILTYNAGTGNAGSISIKAAGGLSVGLVDTSSTGPGANAGSISLESGSGIGASDLFAGARNNGNGGSVTLDSGAFSYKFNNVVTRSAANSSLLQFSPSATNTGSGSAGLFKLLQFGLPVANPEVVIANNSQILVDGNNVGSTSDVVLNILGSPQLGNIATVNIHGAGGTAGNITLTSTSPLLTGNLVAAGLNNSSGGSITLDSSANDFRLGSLYTRSASGMDATAFASLATNTGTGSAGTLTFKQAGAVITNPRVGFQSGANVMSDGTNAGSTSNISLVLANSNALGNVVSYNLGAGRGGDISLTSNFLLSTGHIWSAANGNAGNINLITAAGVNTNGNPINAASVTGDGGSVFILGNNAIQLNHVFANGGNAGGRVIVVSTSNSIATGTVTSFGGTADGGSISMVAPGFIHTTGLMSYSPTIAGNIFISAGSSAASSVIAGIVDSSAGAGGTNGQIFLGANVAGANGPSAAGNAYIQFTQQSNYASNPTPNPYLFYSAGPIVGNNATLSVTSSSVNINPGGYGSIGASGSPVNITLDLGGDSRTIVPLVVTGNAFVGNYTANNTVGGAGPSYLRNGYVGMITSGNNLTLSGNVTADPAAGGAAGDILLYAINQIVFDGAGSVGSATGANSVSMYAFNGVSATPGSNVSITTPGSIFIRGDINVSSVTNPGGSVSIVAGSGPTSTLAIDGINTSSNLNAGTIFLSAGGKVSTGDLVAAGWNNGTGGDITLNSDIGSFAVGSLVTRSASGTNVSNYAGDTGSGLPGQLLFQQNGAPMVTANVGFRNNSVVLLDGTSAGSTTSLNINLANDYAYLPVGDIATVNFGTGVAGNVTITSCCSMNLSNIYTSAFSQAGNITLTTTKGLISTRSLIAAGMNNTNGGNITLDSSFGGFSVGSLVTRSTTTSNPMVNSYTGDTGSGIAGQLVFQVAGVPSANPSVFFINGSSVLVDGTNAGSTSTINFNLVGHGGPTYSVLKDVVTINLGTGTPGNITLYESEPLTINQVYTSPLADLGSITISTIGNLTTTSDFHSANINLTTLVDPLNVTSNGNIRIGGNLFTGTAGSAINLTADGSGNITQTNLAYRATAPTITIASGNGNIGSLAIPVQTDATTLSAITGYPGAVYVNNAGAVNLANAQAGTDLRITAGGTIQTMAGGSFGGQDSVYFQTTANNGNIVFPTTAINTKLMTAITHGSGTVVVPAGGGHIQGIVLLVDTANLINNGNVWGSGGFVNSLMTVTRTNGDMSVSGSGNISYVIGSGIINVGSNTTGNITFSGSQFINAKPGGAVNMTASNSVNVNAGQSVAIGGQTFQLTAPNINIGNGGSLSSGPTIQAATQNIASNGTIFSLGDVNIASTTGLNISGNGSITGTAISLTAGGGSLNAVQGGYTGTITGTAAGGLSITGSQGFSTANMTASNGNLSLISTGGLLQITDTSNISATANVTLQGTSVNVGTNGGTGVVVNAGRISPFVNINSVNINDYDYSAFTTPGGISVTATAGSVAFGSNAAFTSRGASIGTTASGNITLAGPDTFIAQGGNVWFNSGGNVTVNPNVSVTAVARYIPNAQPITIDTIDTADFLGGDVAINSGSIIPSFDQYLRDNFDLMRLRSGTYTTLGNVTLTNTTTTNPLGGTVYLAAPGAGVVTVDSSTLTANGSVVYIDPGGTVSVTGATLGAFGSPLAPFVPPAPPPIFVIPALVATSTTPSAVAAVAPTGSAASAPGSSVIIPALVSVQQEVVQGNNARTVPIDQNRENVQTGTIVTPNTYALTCVPAAIANYSENDSWSVASGNCQAFSSRSDDGSVIVGQGGTAVSRGENGLKMKEGRMVAVAGQQILLIETPKGTVSLPPNSSAIIEQKSTKVLRVTQLTGQNATIALTSSDKRFTSAPGEEVLVADEDTEDEELIPVDGVDRVSIEASIKVSGMQVRKDRFNRQILAQKEKLLNCINGCIPVQFKQRLDKVEEQLSDKNGAPSKADAEDQHFVPIAHVQSTAPRAENLCTSTTSSAIIKHTNKAAFSVDAANMVSLKEGEILVAADELTSIRTPFAMVTLAPSTIALISRTDDTLKVRSLHDTGLGSIKVYSGKQSMPLTAGQEIIVATTYDTASKNMNTDGVGRRKLTSTDLLNGRTMTHCEYSFLTLLSSSPTLIKVMRNSDSDCGTLTARISKMMVMLGIVTHAHGQFSRTSSAP